MSEMEVEPQVVVTPVVVVVKPEGKGMGIAGFVISLVALLFSPIVFASVALSVGLGGGMSFGYFWVVVCLLSVILSVMGMIKLGKTGGKRGLAIAGMIIGIVALIWSVMLLMGVNEAGNQLDKNNINLQELNNALDDLKKEHEN